MPLAGKRVLIHAGSGGVGSIAVQIAKAQGAHVTTTCSTPNVQVRCNGHAVLLSTFVMGCALAGTPKVDSITVGQWQLDSITQVVARCSQAVQEPHKKCCATARKPPEAQFERLRHTHYSMYGIALAFSSMADPDRRFGFTQQPVECSWLCCCDWHPLLSADVPGLGC